MNVEGLKVALVFDDSLGRVGGVGQYVRTLGRGLTQLGAQPTFLVGETTAEHIDGIRVRSMSRNVPVRSNGGAGTMPLPSSAHTVAAVLEEGAFDLVHVQMPYSPLMAGRIISRLDPKVALIGTYHVSTDRPLARIGARLLGRVCQRSLRRFDQTVAVSETAALSARQMFGVEVDAIIPNMVDVARFQASVHHRSAHPGPHLVYLGALAARKGVHHLLGAAALLRSHYPQLLVTIAGTGPLADRLQRLARGLNLAETVNFVGEISEREKAELFWAADLACFPAAYGESFGVVLLEAMAAGTPVLAANNPGFVELLSLGQALCAPRPEDIAIAARGILDNSIMRGEIKHSQQALVATFDIDRVTSRVVDAYAQALRNRERLLSQKCVTIRGPRLWMNNSASSLPTVLCRHGVGESYARAG